MTHADWAQLSRWTEASVQDEDGTVMIRFGLAATLYFRNGHAEDKRRAALECFNEFHDLCRGWLRWQGVGADAMRMSPVAKLQSHDMSPFLLSSRWNEAAAREHPWFFYWHGGERPDDASPVRIYAYGSPRMYAELDDSLSFLQVSFPVLAFHERPEGFLKLILRWCERLEPYHGYGGVTLLNALNSESVQSYGQQIAALAARHPGIEIDEPMSHKRATQNGIKGGNWLTVLSTVFVGELGGADELRQKLGEPFVVNEYSGGVMIVAGQVPEVGDRNRNVDTPLYKRLARVLEPIRIREHPKPYVEGRFARDGEFAAWLARFDQ